MRSWLFFIVVAASMTVIAVNSAPLSIQGSSSLVLRGPMEERRGPDSEAKSGEMSALQSAKEEARELLSTAIQNGKSLVPGLKVLQKIQKYIQLYESPTGFGLVVDGAKYKEARKKVGDWLESGKEVDLENAGDAMTNSEAIFLTKDERDKLAKKLKKYASSQHNTEAAKMPEEWAKARKKKAAALNNAINGARELDIKQYGKEEKWYAAVEKKFEAAAEGM